MKILHWYIGKSLLITFVVTLLVMIGILCLGNLIRIADLIIKGLNVFLVIKFLWFLIIRLLQYAVPMAVLTATLLVFGRLSAENEITAMRASGVGLRTISLPVFLLGIFLTIFAIYLNNTAIPNNTFAIKKIKSQIGVKDPEVLLEAGELVNLPGYDIFIQGKQNKTLKNIWINQYEEGRLSRTIMAREATLEMLPANKGFILHLDQGIIDETHRKNSQITTQTKFVQLDFPINLEDLYDEREHVAKRTSDLTWSELLQTRRDFISLGVNQSMIARTTHEIHSRLSLSLACFFFVVIGVPLAIKAHRSEKSIGMVLSLILMLVFYLFILSAKAVSHSPQYYPYIIVWIPNILYGGLGIFWMLKFSQI